MKKVFYIFGILAMGILASCQKDPVENTACVDMAGDWYVTIDAAKNGQVVYEDVYGLFYDSYRCHKNDIDRPAYLLAYQGMMQFVRLTVLQSVNKPTGFADAEWENQWLCPLRDDDKWDGIAFNVLNNRKM